MQPHRRASSLVGLLFPNRGRSGRRQAHHACVAESLEGRVLMALAAAAGGSGYSGTLSTNTAIRKQQLACDPNEPMSGSTSVQYNPQLVTLSEAHVGPGYRITRAVAEVQSLDGQQRTLQPLTPVGGGTGRNFTFQPVGRETGFVQIEYALDTANGQPGQIQPRYTLVDQRGVDGVDTHELIFTLHDEQLAPQTAYRIFAAPANSRSGNPEDFLVTPEGVRIGPGGLSPATVFGDPTGEDTTSPSANIVDISPDPRRTPVNSITISFDEPVRGFDLADLTLTRNGGNNLLQTFNTLTTTDNKTFVLSGLENLTGPAGSYVLALDRATSGVTDPNGNPLRNAPTDAWAVDLTAPTVTSASFLHTPPHRMLFDFSENVQGSVGVNDLTLENLTTGATVPASSLTMSYNTLNNVVTFAAGGSGMLANGNYRATVNAAGVTDAAGNAMAANSVLNFYVLTGDVTRNRVVDSDDFIALAANFGRTGRTFAQGDVDGNGTVNSDDFIILAANFAKTVPEPRALVAAPQVAASSSVTATTPPKRVVPVRRSPPSRTPARLLRPGSAARIDAPVRRSV